MRHNERANSLLEDLQPGSGSAGTQSVRGLSVLYCSGACMSPYQKHLPAVHSKCPPHATPPGCKRREIKPFCGLEKPPRDGFVESLGPCCPRLRAQCSTMSLLSLYHCHLVLPVPCPVPQGHSYLCAQPLWLPLCGAMDQPDPGAVATKGGRWWLASKLSPKRRDLGAEVPERQDRVLHRKGPGRGRDHPIPPAALGKG